MFQSARGRGRGGRKGKERKTEVGGRKEGRGSKGEKENSIEGTSNICLKYNLKIMLTRQAGPGEAWHSKHMQLQRGGVSVED